jgi:hypothetical protein
MIVELACSFLLQAARCLTYSPAISSYFRVLMSGYMILGILDPCGLIHLFPLLFPLRFIEFLILRTPQSWFCNSRLLIFLTTPPPPRDT